MSPLLLKLSISCIFSSSFSLFFLSLMLWDTGEVLFLCVTCVTERESLVMEPRNGVPHLSFYVTDVSHV